MTALASRVAGVVPPAWRPVARTGVIGGVIAIYLSLVGIVPVFNTRPLIAGVLSLGQGALLMTLFGAGYLAARRAADGPRAAISAGVVSGLVAGTFVSLLVLVGALVNLRAVFLHASPDLYAVVTFRLGTAGFWIPALAGAVLGGLAALIYLLPPGLRSPLSRGLLALIIVGLFAGLIRTPMLVTPLAGVARLLFAAEGLTLVGTVVTFVAVAGGRWLQTQAGVGRRISRMPSSQRRIVLPPLILLGLLIVIVLPLALGSFVAQVIALVALYVLMGLGLNITLGLAGLLDLGFVAFFAVGGYTVGLLTSLAEYGVADLSFWVAVPVAVILAMLFGAFLGLPILGIRGDYLAIATLGFGEIIRLLAGSDLLKPILGGPRGIVTIPKPIGVPPDHFLAGPNQIYYIALVFAALIALVAMRLAASRIGRAWLAIREDEDVAEALGINLVQTKLLAYMLGAAFAGLGGAVFAGLVGSIFPSSINLFVSINVAALIIVGGMGSIPGVIVGAIFLIGLPELFREFSEYRYLFYGVALIAVMQLRPEGLLPSRIVQRELHEEGAPTPVGATVGSLPSP